MRCVECGARVDSLYTEYSKDNFRLTQCPACLKFADKYIEFDYVILTIDVMLLKPQVYRHLLFNSLARNGDRIDPSVVKLGLLLVLFDVYLTWYRVDRQAHIHSQSSDSESRTDLSKTRLYLYYLALSLFETIVFHASTRLLSQLIVKTRKVSWNMISTALFVSSCAKLVPVFMVIWEYDIPEAAVLIDWVVVIYNIEAIRILLETGYLSAITIILTSVLLRTLAVWTFVNCTALAKHPGMGNSLLSGVAVLQTLFTT